jgi:hypothetical protein
MGVQLAGAEISTTWLWHLLRGCGVPRGLWHTMMIWHRPWACGIYHEAVASTYHVDPPCRCIFGSLFVLYTKTNWAARCLKQITLLKDISNQLIPVIPPPHTLSHIQTSHTCQAPNAHPLSRLHTPTTQTLLTPITTVRKIDSQKVSSCFYFILLLLTYCLLMAISYYTQPFKTRQSLRKGHGICTYIHIRCNVKQIKPILFVVNVITSLIKV